MSEFWQLPARRRQLAFGRGVFRFSLGHTRDFRWRETRDPYSVLMGEVLLQRTSGAHVDLVFATFLERWPDALALSQAREGDVADTLRPLGLAKRVPYIVELGRELAKLGRVPLSPSALMELPGVGRYTAHAVPVFTGNRNLPLVDWVIARVLRRYFGLPDGLRPNTDDRLWVLAAEMASVGRARTLWLGTLDLANMYCRPRPRCESCPLCKSCRFGGEAIRSAGK